MSCVAELTWLHTAWPHRTNVAKCSLLKFIRSYLNSCCRKVSQRCLTVSCGDGTRLCLSLLTLIRVPWGSLISETRCEQILVFFRARSPVDFGTSCWKKLRQAFCVMFSSRGETIKKWWNCQQNIVYFSFQSNKKKEENSNEVNRRENLCLQNKVIFKFLTSYAKMDNMAFANINTPERQPQPRVHKLNQVSDLCCGHALINLRRKKVQVSTFSFPLDTHIQFKWGKEWY